MSTHSLRMREWISSGPADLDNLLHWEKSERLSPTTFSRCQGICSNFSRIHLIPIVGKCSCIGNLGMLEFSLVKQIQIGRSMHYLYHYATLFTKTFIYMYSSNKSLIKFTKFYSLIR